jgi:ribonuclease VapC
LIVLDASAMLAVLRYEAGADCVVAILPDSIVSSVNVAEVHTKLIDGGMDEALAWSQILALGAQSFPFDDAQARTAGALVRTTRPYGLSLGDRACLALAIDRGATAYTADRAWKSLNLGIKIEVIR